MTAISTLAEQRVNDLYPDEHYDIHTHTFIPIEEYKKNQAVSNGAKTQKILFSSFFSSFQTMPTLKELEELFKAEMSLQNAGNQTSTDDIATFAPVHTNTTTSFVLLMILLPINIILLVYFLFSFGVLSFLAGLFSDIFANIFWKTRALISLLLL